MPVARIYTRVPEESTALIERLRARGYTVELVDPGDFRVTPADLEIRLDRKETGEAFAAAAEFGRKQRSEQNGVEIFVAEGVAVDDAALHAAAGGAAPRGNIVLDGLKRLIAPFRRAGREVHMSRAGRRRQVIAREAEREAAAEAARQQRAEAKAAARAERERQEEIAHAERERREAAARVERERREEVARAEREQGQKEEEVRRAAEREAGLAREREEDARRQEEEALRRAERAAILAREREEEARAEAERQEAARQMEAEAEQRRQHAEAAAKLAAEQEASARADRENTVPVAAEVAAPVAAESAAPAAQRPPRPRVAAERYAPRERDTNRVMKRAFVAAACLAVLAAIGWGAYENRTPASPLSNSERVRGNSIQQDVPFGAARINGQGNATRPVVTPAAKTVQQSAQTARKPAAAKPAGTKPAASTPKGTRHAANDAGMIAEDQVIYHGAPKKSTNRAAAQQHPPVKKISDMD